MKSKPVNLNSIVRAVDSLLPPSEGIAQTTEDIAFGVARGALLTRLHNERSKRGYVRGELDAVVDFINPFIGGIVRTEEVRGE